MRLRQTIIFTLILGLLLATISGQAQIPRPSEYQLKAAFLFNFAKFIDWPPEALANDSSPFIIGILGDNPFGNDLAQTVAGKRINDHPIKVQTFHSIAEVSPCQMLFISTTERNQFPEILQTLHSNAVLTVSETAGFIEAGGMVNFVSQVTPQGTKFRFQINQEAAKVAHLKISSKLLNLAVAAPR
jgi:hypothetical protein